MQDGETN